MMVTPGSFEGLVGHLIMRLKPGNDQINLLFICMGDKKVIDMSNDSHLMALYNFVGHAGVVVINCKTQ